jgi:hypothetical protein
MRTGAITALLVIAASARGDVSTPGESTARTARNARLVSECANQLTAHDSDFRQCWARYQKRDDTGGHRKPFFDLTVGRDGTVKHIVYFVTDTAKTRECLGAASHQLGGRLSARDWQGHRVGRENKPVSAASARGQSGRARGGRSSEFCEAHIRARSGRARRLLRKLDGATYHRSATCTAE